MDSISNRSYASWELVWAPYDQPTYDSVLDSLRPEDVVLEIGAGDLRLALQMARVARKVYAIEIHFDLIEQGLNPARVGRLPPEGATKRLPPEGATKRLPPEGATKRLPPNLTILPGDARCMPFPAGITTGVLLMRHCTHFKLYAEKLKALGGERLITNARWRLGVEVVDLQAPRQPFASVKIGAYACWCGAVGFVPGPAECYTPELDQNVAEVATCPECTPEN